MVMVQGRDLCQRKRREIARGRGLYIRVDFLWARRGLGQGVGGGGAYS